MSSQLVCWQCGASLDAVKLPFRRLEQCPQCGSELHCCRMCQSYDPHIAEQCCEDQAEEVREKQRANFCDYFKPIAGAYVARDDSQAKAARSELDTLFGGDESNASADKPSQLDDLFNTDKD